MKESRPSGDEKAMAPAGHVGPRRWAKYVARNLPLVTTIKRPERYLHAAARRRMKQ
jgi:hypothetical protein